MSIDARISRLERELEASAGMRIRNRRIALRRSAGIFNGNYLILRHTLDRMETPGYIVPLLADEDENRLEQHVFNVALVLHNFLAGAATLKEHTKVFRDEMYSGSMFAAEYDDKYEAVFDDSPLVQFVLKLRNYTLHERLPITGAWVSAGGDDDRSLETGFISLEVRKLREHRTQNHKKWNVKSRTYLDGLNRKVKIRTIADGYKAVVDDFYEWFARTTGGDPSS